MCTESYKELKWTKHQLCLWAFNVWKFCSPCRHRPNMIKSLRVQSVERSHVCIAPHHYFSTWSVCHLGRPTLMFTVALAQGWLLSFFSPQHMMSSLNCPHARLNAELWQKLRSTINSELKTWLVLLQSSRNIQAKIVLISIFAEASVRSVVALPNNTEALIHVARMELASDWRLHVHPLVCFHKGQYEI